MVANLTCDIKHLFDSVAEIVKEMRTNLCVTIYPELHSSCVAKRLANIY